MVIDQITTFKLKFSRAIEWKNEMHNMRRMKKLI